MFFKKEFFIICFMALLCSCVSQEKYLDLENTCSNNQLQMEQKNKQLKAESLQMEEARDKCLSEMSELHGKNSELQIKNTELARKIESMHDDLIKKKSLIKLQDGIINTKKRIEESLKVQLSNQEIKIEEMEGKLKVSFIDKILFNTGSARVNKKGREVLLHIADSIRDNKDQNIMVEGHTDDVPIGSDIINKFPTNWELSTARATAVVRFLQDKGKIEPERFCACGYSFYKPLVPNDTDEGRSQNRRIEIILIPPSR
ncbi:chemotaxis protein MotB [Candidatus Magnetomoraceae bacterium gMMP-15]